MSRTSFTNGDGLLLVTRVADAIIEQTDYLSELDGAAGDGDHGVNMAKGMELTLARLAAEKVGTMSAGFLCLSTVLVSEIGGSMGPLYGSFFRGLALSSREAEDIDRAVFLSMLDEGLARIRRVTQAQKGDKTLIDVLEPALDAFAKADALDASFPRSLADMISAAQLGLASTKDLTAKVGRSSRLGERSRGHLDAGAASCTIILTAMAEAATALLDQEAR